MERSEQLVDVLIESELTALDQLHGGDSGDGLRSGSDEERGIDVDRCCGGGLGGSVRFCEHDLPVAYDSNRGASYVLVGERLLDRSIDRV